MVKPTTLHTPHRDSVDGVTDKPHSPTRFPSVNVPPEDNKYGLIAGLLCYVIWGGMPLFFNSLGDATPLEILAHRVVWSLVFCVLILTITRRWSTFRTGMKSAHIVKTLGLATVLILVNWLTYVFAVSSGHVLDASLGYYINPLVTVVLAVVVLKERVAPLTWVALGFGAAAVIVMTAGMGTFPWISIVLALSFGFYGLIKSRIGQSVDSVTSLSIETLLASPLALVYLCMITFQGASTFASDGAGHGLLLVSSGIITALPLILFGFAAQNLKLSTLGLLQYVGPTIQFLIALFVYNEPMPPARWIGFALVWVAVILAAVATTRTHRVTEVDVS